MAMPKVVMIQEPFSEKDSLKKIWEYQCPVELVHLEERPVPNSVLINKRYMFTSGGSVSELPDNSLYVSTNSPYSTIFIVNMKKKLLWSANLEKWHDDKKEWQPYSQYRSSIIPSYDLLENLIWTSAGE